MAGKRLFLLDGTALAYRAHFALSRSTRLTSKSGKPTGAIYGFLLTLRRLLEEEKPEYLAVALDPPTPTFRHKRYPEYKSTRQKAPEELIAQLPTLREVLDAYHIPVVEVAGFEADDVIGTLAKRAEAQGFEVLLVSRDKDFYQLVSERVRLYDLFESGKPPVLVGPPQVVERFGVPPERVVDALALMGDASDNVPGVAGIGEKTAIDLLKKFGSVDQILARLEEVEKPKVREALRAGLESLHLSRELVTIETGVLLDLPLERLKVREPDAERLTALFHELDFRTLLSTVVGDAGTDEHRWTVVDSEEAFAKMLERLRGAERLAVDSETTGLDPMRADLVGLSFCPAEREAWYLPLRPICPVEGGIEGALARLRPILEDRRIEKVGQNAKYDALMLRRAGIEVAPIGFDTMVADYCVDPSRREHNLDALALEHLRYRKIPTSSLIGKGKADTMLAVDPQEVGRYACEDADITMRLVPILERALEGVSAVRLFRDVEMPLVPVLASMEERGVKVDAEGLRALSRDFERRLKTLETEIQGLAGSAFNVASNPQLAEILFEKLRVQEKHGVKRPRRTKTGYAVDADSLEPYAAEPLVAKVLEHRSMAKLKNTYLDALPDLVNPRTGRIHTSYNQTVAATGRLSSSDPNLQNIPIRTDLGKAIRRAFVPGNSGWKLLSADYSQIELRLVAHFSGDERLIAAFEKDRDVHRETAAAIFRGGDSAAVSPEERSRAKAINFGILYGMGPARLARETGMSFEEAQTFIRVYFETFPAVRAFLDRTLAEARRRGYVETILGRRRPLPELAAEDERVAALAQNVAVNTPLQGSAADLIKKAMVALDARLRGERGKAAMLLQVHDELVFEAPQGEVDRLSRLVREEMEGVERLRVPLKVDVGVGENWLEAH